MLRGAKHWMLMPIVPWCPGFVLGICSMAKPNMYAVLQVDVLKLTVERLGSASKGLCSGAYRNVESLSVTHVTREDDVQVRWASIRAGLPAGRGCLGLLWRGQDFYWLASQPLGRPVVIDLLWCRIFRPGLAPLNQSEPTELSQPETVAGLAPFA